MEDNSKAIYKSIGRYSLWFAITGVICYLTLFPDGIYYGFFCGVMAVASAIVSKKYVRGSGSTAGLILGIIDTIMALMAFYGIYLIYSTLNDPVLGPRVTEFISDTLSRNGLSLEIFAQMMGR